MYLKFCIYFLAMQQQIGEGVRTPTQLWSGYGFSKSMPDYAARMKKAARNSGSISEYLDVSTLMLIDRL